VITIIEGPDGAGKTTLAKYMMKVTAADLYVHCGPPKCPPFLEYFNIFQQVDNRHWVLDRYHLGERVYGPVYREEDGLGAARQRMLERALFSKQAIVVRCLPPLDVVIENWKARKAVGGEMLDNVAQLIAVYEGFKNVKTMLPETTYDYTSDDLLGEISWLNTIRPETNLGPGAGHFRKGNTLIVGEQCGPKDITGLPFIGDAGSCSLWLAERLDEWNVNEHDLYWINALRPDGELESPAFIEELCPEKIIALGKIAHRWCDKYGLTHVVVPHPQFWKRFHYHKPYPLKDLL
jgi:hypothetical protein